MMPPNESFPTNSLDYYPISEDEFRFIADKANSDFGLSLHSDKIGLVQSRLSKRLRLLGICDFASYCLLLSTAQGQQEAMHMLSALTTNVTHFFREVHHFETLRNEILPTLRAASNSGNRLRIWSAGCSAGQEPYSVAATILESWPDVADIDFRILATDVDPEVLKVAESGTYGEDEISKIPSNYRKIMFPRFESGDTFLNPKISSLIKFARLNLIEDWPMTGKFDVIFCRNVAIYFDKNTQAKLWERFHNILTPGGVLFIGHSERLSGKIEYKFDSMGVTTYRRIGN